MIYQYDDFERFECEKFEEYRIYHKEKKICKNCMKKKKKYVAEFAYYDKALKKGRVFMFDWVCENCFELELYTYCVEKFYGEKIFNMTRG